MVKKKTTAIIRGKKLKEAFVQYGEFQIRLNPLLKKGDKVVDLEDED